MAKLKKPKSAAAPKKRKAFIAVAGNIGAGKSSLTQLLSLRFGWKPFYESVEDNPYLNDFYADMKRWSFNLQVYFLSKRFNDHKKIGEVGIVVDRFIERLPAVVVAEKLCQRGLAGADVACDGDEDLRLWGHR